MYDSTQKRRHRGSTIGASILFHGPDLPGRLHRRIEKESEMSLGTILLVVLILALLGVIPTWPHSRNWGYGPSGGVGLIVIILVVLLLLGRI
jgi:hypothetical protein